MTYKQILYFADVPQNYLTGSLYKGAQPLVCLQWSTITVYLRARFAVCEPYFMQSLMVWLFGKYFQNLGHDDHEVLYPFCLCGE